MKNLIYIVKAIHSFNEGTPYEVKVSRTVWSGGKSRDYFKGLPIAIVSSCNNACLSIILCNVKT